jgi:3-phosphoshikimate 1-carboxyvinyltransferase
MPLPDVIQIRPYAGLLNAHVSIPGSKSLTNRALILAALTRGKTELRGALWAEDTRLMVAALQTLGFAVEVREDDANSSNRTILVEGLGGEIPVKEAELYVGTAGTAARFLTAFCSLKNGGKYRIHGTSRMHERPMREVFEALRKLGAVVEDRDGFLPAMIRGPIRAGCVEIDDAESSQFASALLLLTHVLPLEVECADSPYVRMTHELLKAWKKPASVREIEPDASSSSYFVALRKIHGGRLAIRGLGESDSGRNPLQIDQRLEEERFWVPPVKVSRKTDLGDSVMTLAAACAAMRWPFHLTDAARLREQECDRLAAMAAEFRKCGVPAQDEGADLKLLPAGDFTPAEIETYRDHRMAMAFAVMGTRDVLGGETPWMTIRDPSCVEKTFPNFFETLESTFAQSLKAAGRPWRPSLLTPIGDGVYPNLVD